MKKSNKKTFLLLSINFFSVILVITAFSGSVFKTRGENLIYHETVLLNPRYTHLVDSIRLHLEKPTEILDISKQKNGFIGNTLGITFPVNSAKVSELIKRASTNTIALFITNNVNDFATYAVAENSTYKKEVSFSANQSDTIQEFSKLFFGSTDFSRTKRYVRSSKSNNVYSIQDEYYTFLNTNPSSWIDPMIIPSILQRDLERDHVIEISSVKGDSKTTLFPGDRIYDNTLNTLFSLQSSVVVDMAQYEYLPIVLSVNVKYRDGYTISIDVLQKDSTTYIVSPQTAQLFYALEISSVTYERIVNSFIE